MTGLIDKAMEINYIIRTNFPGSCRIWKPIYSGNYIRFRVKCKNIPVLCVELTYEQVMNYSETSVASLLTASFIRLLLERIENN